MIHKLKIQQQYFEAVFKGLKTFELRKDDRKFQVGDWILLQEYKDNHYTGRTIACMISYILRNCPEYGLQEGYCILGFNYRTQKG